jgi:hypothetical protein
VLHDIAYITIVSNTDNPTFKRVLVIFLLHKVIISAKFDLKPKVTGAYHSITNQSP